MKLLPIGILLLLAACATSEKPAPQADTPPKDPPALVMPDAVREAAAIAASQEPKAAKLPPVAPPTLVAGDQIEIKVYGQPDLDLATRIPPAGAFTYPLIGNVEAATRTPAAVEAEMRERLEKDFIQDPSVTITVKEYAKRNVYVMGGVQKPSSYEMPPTQGMTLLQLISTAGGFTDRAYKEYAQVVRRTTGSEREVIHLSIAEIEKSVAKGHPEADIPLSPDDLVVIPSGARVVYVLGQVKSPGDFPLPVDTRVTVSMAISQAGSYTKFAATSRIQVLRQPPTGDPVKLSVDLDEVMEGKLDKDIELKPGDIIWVPERGLFQ